jgi:diacylglycerol kinase family enzyme
MLYSTIAKYKETGKDVLLLLNNNQLIITEKETSDDQSCTVETKEIFDLEFIYGIDYNSEDESLKINLIEQDKKVNGSADDKKSTLTNIRPQDIKWNLRTLQFTINNTTAAEQQQDTTPITLDLFATQIKNSALPHQDALPNTKVFVVLNPTSGLQIAETYWKTIVQPMLVTAGFSESNITKILTEKDGKTRNLAEDLGKRLLTTAKENEPQPIVISMGGDGTLHEVINGLEDAVAATTGAHFRLGVIPAGSGNAFALGLNIENIEQATLKIIKGQKEEPFYLMDVKFGHSKNDQNWQTDVQYNETKKPFRLLVVMSWGFHAQIVSKSRYLRYFMGNKRFSLVALFLLKFLQQYEGELVLKNAKKYNPELQKFNEEEETVLFDETTENKKGFTYFIVSKQHSLEKGFKIAPFASPLTNDMDVVVLRGANAETLTKASMEAFQGGTHVNSNHVEYYKTTDLLLRVKHKAELCLDGEIHDMPAKGILHLKVIGSSSRESTFTIFV